MNNFELIAAEKDNHRSLYNVSLHEHNHFEIVYYLSGSGQIIIDNKQYEFEQNTFSLTRPNCLHREFSTDNVSLIYIGFSCTNIDEISHLKNGLYKCHNDVHLLNILKEIKFEYDKKGYYSEEIVQTLLSSLLIYIKRASKMMKSKSKEMDNIVQYIKANITTSISGITVAKEFNYNYDYFRKTFKEFFHVSIGDYIAKEKVRLGKTLLKKTNYSIAKIAMKSGFSSSSHFIATFKKYYNVTPKQFLKNYDKNTKIIH